MTKLRLRPRSSSFHEHSSDSSSGAFGFHDCGSSAGALFFLSMAPAAASVRFYTLMFSVVLVCLKLNGRFIISSGQNKENMLNIFE